MMLEKKNIEFYHDIEIYSDEENFDDSDDSDEENPDEKVQMKKIEYIIFFKLRTLKFLPEI